MSKEARIRPEREPLKRHDKDWPYPPGYNHLLGYREGTVINKGSEPETFHVDRKIKDGMSLNK